MRFGTATGSKDGMLLKVTSKRAVLRFRDGSTRYIPTPQFVNGPTDVVDCPGEDEVYVDQAETA